MTGFWLSSIAWTLPAAKLVLVATLALRHARVPGPGDLLAVLPELGVTCALLLLDRIGRGRALRALLVAIAALLAVLQWLAAAAWAFAGGPVGFALLSRLLLDPTTLRTAVTDPALLPQFAGWLGGLVLLWGLVALAIALLGRATRTRRARRASPSRVSRALLVAGTAAGLVAVIRGAPVPERRLALAVALDGDAQPTRDVALDPDTVAELAPPRRRLPPAGGTPAPSRAIRNVVILVLESLRREPGTPFADGFPEAVRFDRAYAHHPRSVKTLEALLFGLYPSPALLSAAWAIDRYDVAPIALPRLLAAHGFTSHYFSAMSLGFDNYGGTLAAAGFDRVETVTGGEALTWGVAAPELLGRVAETLEEGAARGERRLVMAWTAECHMPYDFSGERIPAGDPRERYRGCQVALARDVATFLERLARDGLLDETLVVVLGDHGQIFASEKQGEVGHGMRVYEQSLRIPVLLFVPGVPGRTDERLFQPVDVPATILAALGIAVPDAWVGRDMLDAAETGRSFVVVLGTLSDGRAATVDAAGEKITRSGASAQPEHYDLAHDPAEERPARASPDRAATAAARIDTYERLAALGWRARRTDGEEPTAFDGRGIDARWAPGPCVATRLTDAGDLRVEPATAGFCRHVADPFERRIARAFDASRLAAGFDVRVTLALDPGATPGTDGPRVLVKQWGSDVATAVALDPTANGFQTVTASLLGKRAEGETMVAVVGVDPAAPYVLRAVTIEPRS